MTRSLNILVRVLRALQKTETPAVEPTATVKTAPARRQRRALRPRTVVVVAAVVALASAAGVFAWWSTSGSGSATASTGTLNAPQNPSATTANSTTTGPSPVAVSWSAPSGGTVAPTGYYVTRVKNSDSSTSAACGTSASSPTSSTSCSDTGVVDGTYHYTVTAVYHSWTATSGSSNDVTVQNKVATSTGLVSSANPSVVGQTVTYTATVSVTGAVPGGTVDFKDGATTVCSAKPLTGSSPYTATCLQTYNATSAGHSITAVYSGDSGTLGSTSSAVNQVVNKAATTTGLASSANPSVVGETVTYTATVAVSSPGSATPTGTVDFKEGGATICTASALSASAPFHATCQQTYNATNAGHSITAVYSGDGTTATSTSSAVSQVVNAAATTTTLASVTNPSVFGQSVQFNVTVAANAPGAGTPTGSVAVKEGGTTVCNVTLSGGSGSCSSSTLSVASHSLTATYTATPNFNGSSSSPALSQVVNKAPTQTTLVSSANPSVTGQSVTYTATVAAVSPGAGTPTSGTVTFTDNGSTITCTGGTQTLNASGQATCTITYSASGGNHTKIDASYGGNTSFASSATTSDLSQTVNKAATTTAVVSSANPSVSGQSITYTATVSVTGPGAGSPSGTVTFMDGSSTISCSSGSQTLNASEQATCTVGAGYLASNGDRSIKAVYNGDTNFSGSTSSTITQTVNKANTTTAVVSAKSPTVVGEQVSYTATASATSPGTGNPSAGKIEFFDGVSAIAACGGTTGLAVDGNGNAVCAVTYTSTGSHTIKAQYLGTSGDYNASAAQSTGITQTVNAASTTTALSSSANPAVFGQSVTLTATVAPVSPGAGIPTGTVNFRDNGTTIGSCGTQALDGTGTATCSTSALSVGTHATITAVYTNSGGNYTNSTSSNFSQTVNAASTTTTLTSDTNPSMSTQPVTLTAAIAVVSPGAGTPTGTVQFKDGANTISGCSSVTVNSGQATCATSFSSTGGHSLSAVFSPGTSSFATSTGTLTQTVNVLDTFTVAANSPQTAGTAFNVTITAKAGASTDTNYSGTKTIDFSGPGNGPVTGTPTYPATVTFTNGVGTASVTLVKKETATITAKDHSFTAITGASGNVVVNAAGASTFALTNCKIGGTTTTCDGTYNQGNVNTFTANINVLDAYGNTPSNTTVTINLGLTGDGSTFSFASGSALTSTTTTITNGTQSGTISVFKRANANETQTVTLSATSYTNFQFTVTK